MRSNRYRVAQLLVALTLILAASACADAFGGQPATYQLVAIPTGVYRLNVQTGQVILIDPVNNHRVSTIIQAE